MVTLPRFCVHHAVPVDVSERPCALDSARNSLALVPRSRKRVSLSYGIDKTRFRPGARNMKFCSERSSISDMMRRKQGSEERGPQLSNSQEKGSRAHEMRWHDATSPANGRAEKMEHRLQTESAQLPSQICRYTRRKNWIVDRCTRVGSMDGQATILAHLRPRLTNGNLCVRAGGIAGERAGLDNDQHSAAAQPALHACLQRDSVSGADHPMLLAGAGEQNRPGCNAGMARAHC